TGEPHLVVDDGARVTGPVDHHADRGPHGEHPVGDHPGQADLDGEPLVPVDRVEVAAGPGVADQVTPVHPDGGGPDDLPDLQVRDPRPRRGRHAVAPEVSADPSSGPRTARVERTVATGVPSSAAISQRVVTMARPARSTTEST